MSDKNAPFWLYDLRSRPQYIAYQNYANLLHETVFKKGLRGTFEKAWLKVQSFYPKHIIKETQIVNYWKKLPLALKQDVKDALLWRTDWYKNTLFTGTVTTEDRRLFVKAYRKPDETILSVHQASFVHYYYHTYFTTVKPTQYDENFVFYPLLLRKAAEPNRNDIATKLITINKDYHDLFRATSKPALDYVHLNLPSLLQKEGKIEFWKSVRALLVQSPSVPSVPVHGDVTPWNLFTSDHILPVLIDYERAGWHVPFYDWWHFQLQYSVLHGKTPSVQKTLKKLQQDSGSETSFLALTGLIYILDQLAHDLQDKEDYPRQQHRLNDVIAVKFKLADDFIRILQDEPKTP